MVNKMGKKSQLFSMSDIFTKLKDINPLIETVIDPGTTGYTSDAYEDDEENNNRISSLSLSEVKTYIIDERVIGILPENSFVCDDDVLL